MLPKGTGDQKQLFPIDQSIMFCFLLAVVVSALEKTCIEMFFNKFSSNIETFEANGQEFFKT